MKMATHRGIRRIIHRVLEELQATARIAKRTSVKGAVTTLLAKVAIQKMNRNGYQEPPAVRKRLLAKHDVMMDYFEKEFDSFAKDYDYNRPLPEAPPERRNRVWMCWWQGLENAPDLVKACVASVQKNAGNHEVTIITLENYKEYIDVPGWLEQKFNSGVITPTNFSDYLRLSLLAAYGGVWLDATFFCGKPELETYFAYPIWSIKRPDYLHGSVAGGYFAGYSLGCSYENRWIFATIRDFFRNYWKENDMLIDYLLIDYMIVLAQRKDSRIADAFREIIPNNSCCDELIKVLDQPYDEEKWLEMKQDTALFKLSWKQSYQQMKDGQQTFYARLLEETL